MKLITNLLLFTALSMPLSATVYVNQLGVQSAGSKLCYTDFEADSFAVTDIQTGDTLFNGELIAQGMDDTITGLNLSIGDFSAFSQSGTYRIVAAGETSCEFEISDTVYTDLFRTMSRSLFLSRCGTAISSEHGGKYARNSCHTRGAWPHHSTGEHSSSPRPVVGGWHDAGDFGRYVVPASIAIWHMLSGYDWFPELFHRDNLNIPESGNGIPDILDEVRFELEWMLTMQRDDGAVYHKVTTEKYQGWKMPENDVDSLFQHCISTNATADFAASMAQASRVYESYDSKFSAAALSASMAAWSFLMENTGVIPEGGFANPEGTQSGTYSDRSDGDERLWAAAELFTTTGDERFSDYLAENLPRTPFYSTNGWAERQMIALLSFVMADNSTQAPMLHSEIETYLLSYANSLVTISQNNAFGNTLKVWQYIWGSNGGVLNNGYILTALGKQYKSESYLAAAQSHLDYMLGCNAVNYSFVTGVGTHSPQKIHHAPSEADGIVEPVPGLVVNGPNRKLNDAVLKALFDDTSYPARCYADSLRSYASNEPTVYAGSPLVFMAGVLASVDETGATPVQKSVLRPEKAMALHTEDRRVLLTGTVGNVQLKLFTLSGRQITSEKAESLNGTASFTIPSIVSPGIYFLKITDRNRVQFNRISVQ